jgi:transposase InsO family protein
MNPTTDNHQPTFTATDIALRSGTISRQGVAKLLRGVRADDVRVVRGQQKTPAWTYSTIAQCGQLIHRLETDARRQGYRNAESMLNSPLRPPVRPDLRAVDEAELNRAGKLRDLLLPFLRNTSQPAAQRTAQIVARYGDAFGRVITSDYARKLYHRALRRDAGLGDFGRLELYLPDHPKAKAAPEWTVPDSNLADLLPALESRLVAITTPGQPPKSVVRAVWHVAFEEHARLVAEGFPTERAARIVRDFLHARAPFLPRNRDALLKSWNEKQARWLVRDGMPGALADLRAGNGRPVVIPEADIARLRWSASAKHSGRLDNAWREEHEHLTESTRALGKKDGRCPRVVSSAINRVILDGLAARRQGKRYLEKMLGSITRNVESIPSMYAWVMDDLTCTLEIFVRTPDGTTSLRLIQFIGVMDVRSRKFVGWAASLDEAPSAELVCEAFLDAVRRTGKVPHHLFLENGWVFGRSNNIVGKRNESGDVIIAGLAEYGCQVHHFDPQTPTAKGELEKAFDLLQRLMERHPGYTGRAQRYDAPEQFRREQIEMRRKTNPRNPATCRYDFEQGVRALEKMVNEYNATKQHGRLKGLTPDEAFAAFEDHSNPPISLPAKLHWLLASRYRVIVKLSGVRFRHFGQDLRVRGGNLVNHVGRELWAVVDRRDADCVTFMSLDFADVFTEPLRPVVDYDESETSPDSGALANEYETKAEMRHLIDDQYQGLLDRFGDPRTELLRQAQTESQPPAPATPAGNGRTAMIDPTYAAAGAKGERQRKELRQQRKAAPKNGGRAKQIAAREGLYLTDEMASRPGIDEAMKSIWDDDPTEGNQ